MTTAKRENYLAQLQRAIPGACQSPAHGTASGFTVAVQCRHCGPLEALHTEKLLPPEIVRKKLLQRGWAIGNGERKHVCPVHHDHKPEPHGKEPPMPANDTPAAKPVLAAVPKPVPTPDARAAKREAVELLGESFTVATGQFKPGTSDAMIAEMVGLAETAVAQLREEFFGPLQAPSEFRALQDELAQLQRDQQDWLARVERERLQFSGRLEGVQRKLEATAQRNGWRE